jgi:hypothetical protein
MDEFGELAPGAMQANAHVSRIESERVGDFEVG